MLVIDKDTFLLNNAVQNADEILTFYYIMEDDKFGFSFYDINKASGKIKYEISKSAYEQMLGIVENLKGVYMYKYNEVGEIATWSIENILKSTQAFSNNKDKSKNSLEVFIGESTKNNTTDMVTFEKSEDGTYNEKKSKNKNININIQLTLDKKLQKITREILSKEEFVNFPNAGAVIIESDTGKILSMAQKDEIMDIEELAFNLVKKLEVDFKDELMTRYKLEHLSEETIENLDNIARKRGCLISGGNIDYNRIAVILLDEFRGGKIGRISLERP